MVGQWGIAKAEEKVLMLVVVMAAQSVSMKVDSMVSGWVVLMADDLESLLVATSAVWWVAPKVAC